MSDPPLVLRRSSGSLRVLPHSHSSHSAGGVAESPEPALFCPATGLRQWASSESLILSTRPRTGEMRECRGDGSLRSRTDLRHARSLL